MKTFLIILFHVALLATSAGQSVSSATLTLTYKGYSAGAYHVDITNRQACAASVDVNYNSKSYDTAVWVPAGTTALVDLPGAYLPYSGIRIRTKDICTASGNAGWLQLPDLTPLPIKLQQFSAVKKFNQVIISFAINISGGDQFTLEKSNDARHWHTLYTYSDQANAAPHILQRQWIDNDPQRGPNFYRIGNSRILQVQYASPVDAVQVFNNQAQLLQVQLAASRTQLVQSLNPGIYYISINGDIEKIVTGIR